MAKESNKQNNPPRRKSVEVQPSTFRSVRGSEEKMTADGKYNMATLSKFALLNDVKKPDTKSQEWKDYKAFCNLPKKEKQQYAKEYSAWEKEAVNSSIKEDMVLFHEGDHAKAHAEGKFKDYEDSQARYEIFLAQNSQEERAEIVDGWKEEIAQKQESQEQSQEQPEEKTLTAEEELEELKNKNLKGILSVDDQKRLEVLEEEKTKKEKEKSGKGGEATVKSEEETDLTPEEEKNGPFKEGDIIDYMYNDWLIGGANWLYVKGDKYTRKYANEWYDSFKKGLKENKVLREDEKSAKTTKTKAYEKDTDLALAEDLDKKNARIKTNQDVLIERFKLLSEGKYDEANVSKSTRENIEKNIRKYGKEDYLKNFCDSSIEKTKNMSENMMFAQKIAFTITSAEFATEKAKDVNIDLKSEKKLGKRQSEIFAAILSRANKIANEGGNPQEFLDNLSVKATEAKDFASNVIQKEEVNEFGKKPPENEALKDALGQLSGDMKKKDQERTLIQEFVLGDKIKGKFDTKLMENADKEAENKWRKENNIERKENIEKLKKKLGKEGKITSGRLDVLGMTRESEFGAKKTSSTVLVNRLATSKVNDKASGATSPSEATQKVIQELNKNKSK